MSIKVEIGQYREVNKGALKAFFCVVFGEHTQQLRDCRYFVINEKRWISLPQKEIKKADGSKSDFIPLVDFGDKVYLEELKNAILIALKDAKPQEYHAQHKDNQRQASYIQAQSLPSEESPPF